MAHLILTEKNISDCRIRRFMVTMLQSLIPYVEIFMGSSWRIIGLIMNYNCIPSDSLNFWAEAYATLQLTWKQMERYDPQLHLLSRICTTSTWVVNAHWGCSAAPGQPYLLLTDDGSCGAELIQGHVQLFIYLDFFQSLNGQVSHNAVLSNCCLLRVFSGSIDWAFCMTENF